MNRLNPQEMEGLHNNVYVDAGGNQAASVKRISWPKTKCFCCEFAFTLCISKRSISQLTGELGANLRQVKLEIRRLCERDA